MTFRQPSVRRQLFISLLLMTAAFATLVRPLTDHLISYQFEKFQIDEARDKAHRLEILLNDSVTHLLAAATDHGDWKQTADYMQGKFHDYLEENISSDTLVSLDADYIFISDANMSVRYYAGSPEFARQPYTLQPPALPTSRLAPLLSDPRVRSALKQHGGVGLIMLVGERWHILGVSPITYPGIPADRSTYGLIAFGAELSPQRIESISDQIGIPFSLTEPTAVSEYERVENSGDVVMYRIIPDGKSRPMVGLDIRYPQPLGEQIRVTRNLFLSTSLGVFVIGSILIWLLVNRSVISRLERLDHGLQALSNGGLDQLPVGRNGDEVDRLADGVNRLYSELQALNQAWRHEALHDPLTGLGNRAELLRSIEKSLGDFRSQAPLALALLDLDGFKTVNDLYGHAVGDRVLKRVAKCLQETLPQGTASFRLGGDEFAVLLKDWTDEEVRTWAEGLNRSVRSPQFFEHVGTLLSVSIGIAWQLGDGNALLPSELIQRADIALYTIKRSTRDGHATFDESMLSAMQRENEIQRSLREAIEAEQIEAWFQPIVSAKERRVLRFEALARWRHPTIGWIAPAQFITIAEQLHIAAQLDLLVLRKGLSALPSLRAFAPDLVLSVNVSAQSLLHGEYPERVRALLIELGLEGRDIILEITETSLNRNEDALSAPIATLTAQGIHIALDDFGAGHSSLGRLARLQPQGIKLDGSFVQNLQQGGDRVCLAVVGMAREIGVEVIAEYVETAGEADFLEQAGCDGLQGYLFSKPMPLAGCLGWLSEHGTEP
jgi:diguanylate cyclase (GGDEF)-like protein